MASRRLRVVLWTDCSIRQHSAQHNVMRCTTHRDCVVPITFQLGDVNSADTCTCEHEKRVRKTRQSSREVIPWACRASTSTIWPSWRHISERRSNEGVFVMCTHIVDVFRWDRGWHADLDATSSVDKLIARRRDSCNRKDWMIEVVRGRANDAERWWRGWTWWRFFSSYRSQDGKNGPQGL